jgi:hypothetical protein
VQLAERDEYVSFGLSAETRKNYGGTYFIFHHIRELKLQNKLAMMPQIV